jgi:hypothetical protein
MAAKTTLSLTDDEAWLLYRLVIGEATDGPCLLEQPHMQHEHEARTVLAKLSDAVLAIQESNTTKEQ